MGYFFYSHPGLHQAPLVSAQGQSCLMNIQRDLLALYARKIFSIQDYGANFLYGDMKIYCDALRLPMKI
ncbi:hypothetical protein AM504_14605 [Klebsiella michiganensis]|nr:hypothetical protein KONIH1_00505 [Klebsiella oxytoca KONIH1]AUV94997.1 hypothetical protein C2U44_30295 [Klebsiella oxytoca]KLU43281.1 hypothetical protein ABE97_24400 [Klebsiella michiganensis]DAM41805.1 MAG TPA: hypothetical protein [Caudoviricetes sp.]KLU45253.1 hypothetical protein ABE84_19915 [Klebsiella michiganensis]